MPASPIEDEKSTHTSLVWFDIRAPKDTLVAFLHWLSDEQILPMPDTSRYYGPDRFAIFLSIFASRIDAWLAEHDVPVEKDEAWSDAPAPPTVQ